MKLRFHNSLTRAKEDFVPLVPGRVSLYVCGPTVYDRAHLGNARPAVVFDVLTRFLRTQFPAVTYVRNITDVDDKINTRAAALNIPIGQLTETTTAAYLEDMTALGVLPPDVMPRATAHIGEIIAMAAGLINAGFAYVAEGHVLFHVAAAPGYGQLSGRSPAGLRAGARVDPAPYKKDPGDFVLWKPSTPDLPGWDSPWGRGRPGWHIECSAMIQKHLGPTIDIHGGGGDLMFPHHENEIAQSTCAHGGAPLARVWMHNGMLRVDGAKMAKSDGNFFTVHDLLARHPGEAIRWAILSTHYRHPLDWSDKDVADAAGLLDRLYRALGRVAGVPPAAEDVPAGIAAALADDLNTPLALQRLAALGRDLNKATGPADQARLKGALLAAGRVLGFLQADPALWLGRADGDAIVAGLVARRQEARAARDFAAADALRVEIAALGFVVEDGPAGVTWRKA